MDTVLQSVAQRNIDWSALSKTSVLTQQVKQHLTKVYGTLALTVISSAIGSFVEIQSQLHFSSQHSIMTLLATIGLIVWFHIVSPQQVKKRMILLLSIGFMQGITLAPLIRSSLHIDPSIVTTAFLGTSCIFGCFTGMAIMMDKRSYLYIGGILSSAITMMFILSVSNIFMRSSAVYSFQLYAGLLVFCGFVVFDTQLIIEKASNGNKDFTGHSFELFVDFVNIFVKLLVLLSKKEKKEERKRR
eukprot:TRINITY_DN532_c0_g1_i1.p1 TRINITY_DN532_c0_g1~~TRINITY_DN532_c0_g1_i1.p1  ORF type:complete len:244 (-),score=58.38 TRINITY_DN532_c0_g1_i1:109-840(-)